MNAQNQFLNYSIHLAKKFSITSDEALRRARSEWPALWQRALDEERTLAERKLTIEARENVEATIMSLSKNYERDEGLGKADSIKQVFRSRPDLARAYESRAGHRAPRGAKSMQQLSYEAGIEVSERAKEKHLNFREAIDSLRAEYPQRKGGMYAEGFGAIGDVVRRAKLAMGATGGPWIPAVIAEIRRSGRAKQIAGEWLQDQATEAAQRMTGIASENYPTALRDTMQKYPAAAAMWSTGAVSEEALREIFVQWFNS